MKVILLHTFCFNDMKNIFRYPLVIAVMVIAIFAEGYSFKEDLGQFNNKTLRDLEQDTDIEDLVDTEDVGEVDPIEEVKNEPVTMHMENFLPDMTKVVVGNPYEINPVYADTYKDGIFDGVLYKNVEDSYFDDAVFIGDSRIEGLNEYGGLDNADFYYLTGLSIYDVFKKDLKSNRGGKKKLEKALEEKQYKKIYLMVGVNELGTGTDQMYADEVKAVVEQIHTLEPKAIIYVHGIMWVTQNKSSTDKYINNKKINSRNFELQNVIDNKNCYYLEINSVFGDESGNLNKEYSGDDVHLYAKYYYMWTDYLKSHAIAGR